MTSKKSTRPSAVHVTMTLSGRVSVTFCSSVSSRTPPIEIAVANAESCESKAIRFAGQSPRDAGICMLMPTKISIACEFGYFS